MDVESTFESEISGIDDNEYNRKALYYIDKCKYLSEDRVVCPFGYAIGISDLSTGCKAAILAGYENYAGYIDLSECGINVRDFIIKNATNANLIIDFGGLNVSYDSDSVTNKCRNTSINVCINGTIVHSVEELNEYLDEN